MSSGDADKWVAFVRARLDEDEAAAAGLPACWEVTRNDDFDYVIHDRSFNGLPKDAVADCWREDAAAHIARHDPARALREVESGRRILARHQPRSLGTWQVCSNCRPVDPDYPDDLSSVPWPCPDFRDLAGRWTDHPDYAALARAAA